MRRRPSTIFAVISLMLCVATCALWVRSYFVWDALKIGHLVSNHRGSEVRTFLSNKGVITLQWQDGGYSPGIRLTHHEPFRRETDGPLEELGFGYYNGGPMVGGSVTSSLWELDIPDWLVVLVLSILPAAWLYRRMGFGVRAGRCRQCGYDLRATPDRCPECGTVPPRVKA